MILLQSRGANAGNSRLSGGVTTIAEDDFTRSDASLDGATMSDGSSTWEGTPSRGNGFSVVSNVASCDDGNVTIQTCDSMSNTADLDVSLKVTVQQSLIGVAARITDGNNFYWLEWGGSAVLRLWIYNAGSPSQLGSDGSSVSANDVIKLRCQGTSIKGYINGVQDISVTNAVHSTGKAGLVGKGVGAKGDDWKAETL